MTSAEAAALLTPELQARIDEFVATAPPLSEAQQVLLAALLSVPVDSHRVDAA